MRSCRPLAALVLLGGALLACAADTKDTPAVKLSKGEQAVLDLTNREREKKKLPPLQANATLSEAARAHSKNMATKRELNHVLDGKGPAERVKAAGYKFRSFGENIASGADLSPRGALELWMNSAPHKENILKEEYTEIGIGIARDDNGEVYYTQVFGTPREGR
jgi:uncharacterized protein YkwD